jgi:hypothetical protein
MPDLLLPDVVRPESIWQSTSRLPPTLIEARWAETRAKYEEDPVESSKRLDPRCGKYVRVAAKSEPFIQSVMTLQHPVLQEAVYNLAVFAQLSRNHVRDPSLPRT